jgi:hypothetical protein
MTRSIHEHRWVYLGDLALVARREETDVGLRRSEYCVECSTIRVQYPSGWYAMQGEATKKFLKQFDGEKPGTVFKVTPKEFQPRHMATTRLGKTLKDISVRSPPASLFKK